MDFTSSKSESFEKIRLNPFNGFSLESSGFMGFVETFHPTCTMLTRSVTTNPNAINGSIMIRLFKVTEAIRPAAACTDNPPSFILTKSGIFS